MNKRLARLVVVALTGVLLTLVSATPAHAVNAFGMTVTPSSTTPGATGVTYTYTLTGVTGLGYTVNEIVAHFGLTTSFPNGSFPGGMSGSASSLSASTTVFPTASLSSHAVSGDYVEWNRGSPFGNPAAVDGIIVITGMQNPSAGTYYSQMSIQDQGGEEGNAIAPFVIGAIPPSGNSVVPADPSAASIAPGSYTTGLTNPSGTAVKCIRVAYDTSVAASSGSLPSGMTAASPTFGAATSAVTAASWGTGTVSTNALTWTYATGQALAAGYLTVNGITHNPTAPQTYYSLVNTYSDTGCTTPVNSWAIAYAITANTVASVTIDPTFTFTLAGHATACNGVTPTAGTSSNASAVVLGHMGPGVNAIGAQDLTVLSNAGSGYTVYIRYSGTMTDGTHTLANVSGTNAIPAVFPSVGTAGFGYTSGATALGTGTAARFVGGNWAALSTTGAEVAYGSGPSTATTTCVAYQAGAAANTPAGSYATTVLYTAVPTF